MESKGIKMARKAKKKKGSSRKTARKPKDTLVADLLRRHLGRVQPQDLSISEREFPFRVRADLQKAMEQVISKDELRRFCGVRKAYDHEGLDFAGLLVYDQHYPPVAVPPQFEEIDVGEEMPVRC